MTNENQSLNDAIKALKDHLDTIDTGDSDLYYDLISCISDGLISTRKGSFEFAKYDFKMAHDIARMLEAKKDL